MKGQARVRMMKYGMAMRIVTSQSRGVAGKSS